MEKNKLKLSSLTTLEFFKIVIPFSLKISMGTEKFKLLKTPLLLL
jgi:hypothetical protein